MNTDFTFKKFKIKQEKTAMKVGTDAVLLGSWATIQNDTNTILDIGSGTGIISLMLAQRSDAATIDAVEIEENAYEQTVDNFENSIWSDRLFCYHADFIDFADEMIEENETYDLIVSNPPFYTDDFQSEDKSRNQARFETSLSFEKMIDSVSKILSKNGIFSVIIPFKEERKFVNLCFENNMFLNRFCHVQGNETSPIKRSLLEFSFTETDVKKEHLIIENERHNYTKEYINLTKDFYLKK